MSMVFYGVIIGIIATALLGIAVILVRRFPQATIVDTSALPEERDLDRKRVLIERRVKRRVTQWWKRVAAAWSPRVWSVRNAYRKLVSRVLRLDYKYRRRAPTALRPEAALRKVAALLRSAEEHIAAERYHEAERDLLHVLRLDPRRRDAYELLGGLYMADRQYAQAKETYGFLVTMLTKGVGDEFPEGVDLVDVATQYVRYGSACAALGERGKALEAYEMAVSLEPSNPRYLDLLLEQCILEGDRMRATELIETLRAVNPENKKVTQFEERIRAMG